MMLCTGSFVLLISNMQFSSWIYPNREVPMKPSRDIQENNRQQI